MPFRFSLHAHVPSSCAEPRPEHVVAAVEAARDCLSGVDRAGVTALYMASTSYPFQDRQNSGILAEALRLDSGIQTMDIAASQRAGTSGLIAALQVLAVIVESGKPASEVCRVFEPLPQVLKNVQFNGGKPLEDKVVKKAIADGEVRLGKTGRLLVRPSGTEPVIRVMAEGEDEALVESVVGDIAVEI